MRETVPEIPTAENNPFVPTPMRYIEDILSAGLVSSGKHVIEIGAGDGRILRAAMSKNAVCRGIDLSLRGDTYGLPILHGDYMLADWSIYDVVISGDVADGSRTSIVRKFRTEAKPGSRLVLGHPGLLAQGMTVYEQDKWQ